MALPFDNVATLPDNVKYEDGASLPIPAFTAIQGLYYKLKIPEPPSSTQHGEWFLVWAASSSVGQYVTQFAKASGYRVVATASESNWELVKSLGAEATVDYKDPQAVEKIKKITGGSLKLAYDCASSLSL